MKVRITHPFRDRDNFSHAYEAGEVVVFSEERAMRIISRSLGEEVTSNEDVEAVSETPVHRRRKSKKQ